MNETEIFENIIKFPLSNKLLYHGDFFYKKEGRNLKIIQVISIILIPY